MHSRNRPTNDPRIRQEGGITAARRTGAASIRMALVQADDRESQWEARYERSLAEEARRVNESDASPSVRAEHWRAYYAEALFLIVAVAGAIAMIASGNLWLIIGGCVLTILLVLDVAGMVVGRR